MYMIIIHKHTSTIICVYICFFGEQLGYFSCFLSRFLTLFPLSPVRFERLLRRGADDHGFVHPSSGLRQSLRGLHLGGSERYQKDGEISPEG
jgi:hypothetical protein